MKKFEVFIIFTILCCWVKDASAIMYSGGSGRGEAYSVAGSQVVMSIASAADQAFTSGDASTFMSALTIKQEFSSGDGVTTANGIRIKIPAVTGFTWDPSIIAATVTGPVSGTVSYEDSNRTLVLTATSNFTDGDTVTVSGLKFAGLNGRGGFGFLQIGVDASGTTVGSDGSQKSLMSLATGGSGRGEALAVAGSRAVVSALSASSQAFTFEDGATFMSALTIKQEFSSGDGIGVASGTLKVKIPSTLDMTWDSAVLSATVSGSSHVSTGVSYGEGDKTLILSVTSGFSDGESVTVSGLKFKNFNSSGAGFIQVSIDGGSTVIAADTYDKTIYVLSRSSGFSGGSGRGEVKADINQHPPNAISFGNLF